MAWRHLGEYRGVLHLIFLGWRHLKDKEWVSERVRLSLKVLSAYIVEIPVVDLRLNRMRLYV